MEYVPIDKLPHDWPGEISWLELSIVSLMLQLTRNFYHSVPSASRHQQFPVCIPVFSVGVLFYLKRL